MCGIILLADGGSIEIRGDGTLHCGAAATRPCATDFAESLRSRGPDGLGETSVQAGAATLHFLGSILQMRGSTPSCNPLTHAATGNVLLFNGEIFGGLDVAPGCNDARQLLAALSAEAVSPVVEQVLSRLRGPWAAVFWHAATSTLWYGRDLLGRRSLLLHLPRSADGRLMLASVAPLDSAALFEGFVEVVPGLHSIAFDASGENDKCTGLCASHAWADPWLTVLAAFERVPELVAPPAAADGRGVGAAVTAASGSCGIEIGGTEEAATEAATDAVLAALREAVAVRCRCIDDRTAADTTLPPIKDGAAQGGSMLGDSVVVRTPPARVLILFSGGVDSTLIAALAHEALPPGEPIDLASICFAGGTSPDRLAALDALVELQEISPARHWRLICIDRSLGDVEASKGRLLRLLAPADTVMDLNIGAALWLAAQADGTLHPGIKSPCRGGPSCRSLPEADGVEPGTPRPAASLDRCPSAKFHSAARYCSAARVVLLGHGADELFGGYGRHRTRFKAAGWQGLSEEMALDVRRLWLRNLGRDDRLVADRGREARHPFLDERVVAAALALPLPALADLRLPPGVGDKVVLRRCLRRLGLPRAAARVKRAIQFGSRLARAANVATFGGTRRANARSAGGVRLSDLTLSVAE